MLKNKPVPGYLDGYLGRPPTQDDKEYLEGYERGARHANIDRCKG